MKIKKYEKAELKDYISVRGCRVHNLKNIDVQIPHDQFVVITGVSGSGKSSLAFDTLYAEGQRRYVESLSTYARQFLGRLKKPDCDFIEGISPAIAIEQKVSSRNPRSTVGTSTEIYDYLRMLFARIGRTYSPVSGQEVKKHTTDDIIECMLAHEEGTRLMVMTPLVVRSGRTLMEQLDIYYKTGFQRVERNGEVERITDLLAATESQHTQQTEQTHSTHQAHETHHPHSPHQPIRLVIDRLKVAKEKATINRLVDSANTALYEGDGRCILRFEDGEEKEFSLKFEADGMEFEEPIDQMFSFNSPVGACPECEGYGRIIGIDESLVVPDPDLSVMDGAVACWKGEKMSEWKKEFVRRAEKYEDFPVFTPYNQLTERQKDVLWHGVYEENEWGNRSICIDEFFRMLRENQYKIQYRVMLARYRGKTTCPTCHGRRLKKEAEYVKIGGKSITDLCELPIDELSEFFRTLELTEQENKIAKRLLTEIRSRLQFLVDVGLSYLTLSRLSNSLSGGESQRINLATSLGSSLVGSMYILDEPSIGLHSRDTQRLIHVLRQLQQLGNTVVVVEHDEEIMRAADYLIDIGPDAGRLGGEIMYAGCPPTTPLLEDGGHSHTIDYLTGKEKIAIPETRRPWNNYIMVKNASANNLKGIDVKFPLNVMTCVTGVSGSGKSSLVRDILYLALKRHLGESAEKPGRFSGLEGDLDMIQRVDFVNQNPIGTSSRSNPVTYIGAWDEIRKLLASQQLSKQMGYTPAYFSFNAEGGRCEECKGEGTVTVEMQFMNDLVLECEACHGRRFKSDILEVRYQGMNAYDMLNMTINQAVEFFTKHKQKAIVEKMKPLQDVGLGYIKLGQPSSTLSGGENQRIKLAFYLSQERAVPTLFIFDEPTTGLHFHDISKLLDAFHALITRGHTILIIEHNMDIIKCADHVIDLGPEGGQAGGQVVVTGTPEEVAIHSESYTGQFLKEKLKE
ncbi:MAG: excinuclease ABC subunit UvrA [Bacteroidaceae bacterium]|nr:excinuclease ABC subunit UvrA [Bacteroidaceae bacterium]